MIEMIIMVMVGIAVVLSALLALWIVNLRRVVPTNEVHIIQRSGETISYGKDTENGNTYYKWPMWIPKLGIQTITLPVSNFPIRIESYEAYDSDRLPVTTL
jgi:flotillin